LKSIFLHILSRVTSIFTFSSNIRQLHIRNNIMADGCNNDHNTGSLGSEGTSAITKMSNNINYNYNYNCNGSPMHQHSFASSTSSGETTLWSTTLSSVVSPQTQTTERETLAASFETSTSANVKDVKLGWECVDGVVMTSEQCKMSPATPKKSDSNMPSSWMMSHGVSQQPDETNLSTEEDDENDEDDLSAEDVDFAVGNTLKWLRSEEKEKDKRNKRRAEEQEEEDKKRRATKGYRPAFIIHVDGIPLEVVETERRLAAAAAAAVAAGHLSQWKH
jgi:hypothetical protein